MADDLGYGELGCYGQEKIRTPNIDRLAQQGLRFTQHYTGAPVCAPARCVLMTGQHLAHAEIRDNRGSGNARIFPGQWPFSDEIVTIAEVLKAAGYANRRFWEMGARSFGLHRLAHQTRIRSLLRIQLPTQTRTVITLRSWIAMKRSPRQQSTRSRVVIESQQAKCVPTTIAPKSTLRI